MRAWLIGTGAIYALGAVDFLARPWAATASLSQVGGDKIETEPAGFYNSLASAYMATIAAISFSAAKDPEERKALIPPLLSLSHYASRLRLGSEGRGEQRLPSGEKNSFGRRFEPVKSILNEI